MATTSGFFVDWDGNTRRFEAPGDSYTCQLVDRGHLGVDVLDSGGFVIHEATFFPSLADAQVVGVSVNLVS